MAGHTKRLQVAPIETFATILDWQHVVNHDCGHEQTKRIASATDGMLAQES